MESARIPVDEPQRLAELRRLSILDTPPEERFDRLTRLAATLFSVPIALVSLVDEKRQWFKSRHGLGAAETPRDLAFCGHAILQNDVFVVEDAFADPRFSDNPLVTGDPHVRFYAGQPLRGPDGHHLGTLCVIDHEPRSVDPSQLVLLQDLAFLAEAALGFEIEQRRLRDLEIKASQLEERSTLLDLAHDAIFVLELATDRIRYWNQGAERLYGWTADEAIGAESHLLLQTEYPQSREEIGNVLATGGEWAGELVHRARDGRRVIVASHWAVRRDPAGQAVATLEINRDITDRKQAEADRQRLFHQSEAERARTRAVLDAASDGMVVFASSHRVEMLNARAEELFGYSAGSVVGRALEDLWPEMQQVLKDPAQFIDLFERAMRGEADGAALVEQIYPVRRELEVRYARVGGPDAGDLGHLFSFRDVTKEREVDRMKSEFVSLVSHELRTPLASIKGFVDLLIAGEVGELNPDQEEFLGIIKTSSDRLVALINDLLDISRIESGRIKLNLEPLLLQRIIPPVAESFRPLLDAKDQRLTLELPDGLSPVEGDGDRVTQVLTNLVSNAHKYTLAGGRITVRARQEGGYVWIDVEDTGIGLSAADKEKLFTKFFRASNRATQEAGGTGLGLAITRSLVELQGGQMAVASEEGQGSIFSFSVPLAEDAPADPVAPAPSRQGRVLVVEDDPDIAQLLRHYLEHGGHEVSWAATGADALRLARSERPDVITLDVMLPDTDGFSVLEWLKADAATTAIPVILLSVLADEGRGRRLGAVDYLSKPVSEPVLLERINRALSDRPVRRVLVADDDPDIRALLATVLRTAGYEVTLATNGREALQAAQRDRPDLALLDVRMPELDGLEVLAQLRADAAVADTPVIMMTASAGAGQTRLEAASLGAELIQKPFSAADLAESIGRLVSGR